MLAVRGILAVAYVAERTGADDEDLTRIARCRHRSEGYYAPLVEGAFRLAMRSDTLIRPEARRDTSDAPRLLS